MHDSLIVLYILSILLSLFILYMSIFVRQAPKSLFFSYLSLAIFIYTFGYFFEINAGSFEAAIVAAKMQYLGIPFIAPFLFLFVCEYCAKFKIKPIHVILVMIVPVLAAILVMTWPMNHLFYTHRELATDVLIPRLRGSIGPAYIVFFAYTYIISLCSVGVVAYYRKKGDALFKKQTSALILGTLIPVVGNMINVLKLGSPDYDMTPILMSITCLILGYSMFRGGLYMLGTIAQAQIVENMDDGFILLDFDGNFIDANPAARKLIPELSTVGTVDAKTFINAMPWSAVDNVGIKKEFDIIDDDGTIKHYQAAQNFIENNGRRIGRSIMLHDITEAKERFEEVSQMAEHDALTGLINRGALYKKGAAMFAQFSPDAHAAILMIDIDFFKNINDEYGHLTGDEVLKKVAVSLASNLRATDLVGRYGGEEFCVFLPRISVEDMMGLAEKLRAGIAQLYFMFNDKKINVTISIGAVTYDRSRHENFEAFLSDADTALYKAKHSGRNCVKRY